jgi:hypothetical protein
LLLHNLTKLMKAARPLVIALAALLGAASAFSQSSLLRLDLASTTREPLVTQADAVFGRYLKKYSELTAQNRATRAKAFKSNKQPYIVPAVLRIMQNGRPMPTGGQTRGALGGLTLVIDPTFNSIDSGRVAFMQSVYDNARATMDSVFGAPAINGTVNVVNFDATIGDRQAIVGGYYLPNNGSGGREIRLPLNTSRDVAAVALIHCLLLAYLPDPAYGFDAYLEGIVRATTMRICRLPAAVPALDQATVADVLANSYDVGADYDWLNQKSLGGPQFIANNLLSAPISSGNLGGLFLTRYRMAGSTWAKVLLEYPTFARDLNAAIRANPAAATNAVLLQNLAISTLENISPGGTIEGIPFAGWLREQGVLQTKLTQGTKLHTTIFAITDGLAGTDFGVFGVEATWFETAANGNETLLSGTSYPVFWDRDYNRILASAQSERLDIAGSYGSVAPNFANENAGNPYRVAIDIPVQDKITRQYVPAGAIATPTTVTSDFYGTIVGVGQPAGTNLFVNISYGSESVNDIPVSRFAFGRRIATTNFLSARQVTISVVRKDLSGTPTTILTRKVNKSIGSLGVTLGAAPVSSIGFPSGLPGGLIMVGLSGDPLMSDFADALGTAAFLGARYNPSKAKYDLYPVTGLVGGGQGYFVRTGTLLNPNIAARVEVGDSLGVALRPGWNLIANPLGSTCAFNTVQVVRTTGFPLPYLAASGNDPDETSAPILGKTVFQFVPGANDAVTGLPEGGSFSAATQFAPGIGYFVRCLAPEGAVMLFGSQSSGSRGTRAPRSVVQTSTFRASLFGKGEQSSVFFGMSAAATTGFDARMDSNLPPSMGGMQVSALSPTNDKRYLEYRPYAATSTYRMTLDGLVKGKTYSLVLDQVQGRWTQASAKNVATGATSTTGAARLTVAFVATGSTANFDVTLRGVR